MKNRLDDLASIVNFGALERVLASCTCRCWPDSPQAALARWIGTLAVPICGIIVVLAVFTGMSALALKVGLTWLLGGLIYGAVLKAMHREELRAPL